MSNQLFDWGNRSSEQAAIQRKLEEQALYEQAVRMAQAKQRAGQAVAGGGGGGGDPLNGLYGVGIDGLIYSLNRGEANWPYNFEPFPDITQITLNTDDGFLYAILEFEGTVYFLRIDKTTRDITFIDNTISDYTVKGASSLYYEGEGKFIYLDNLTKKSTISSIVRIELNQLSPETTTAAEVSEVDSNVAGYLLRNLFLYDGTPWAIGSTIGDPTVILIGPFDIDAGDFVYSNVLIPSPSETRVEEILSVFSTVEHQGTVYAAIAFADAELNGDPSLGLFRVDTETGGTITPYYVSFIKDLLLEGHNGVPVLSLFSF
jgi:hypothetical protein